MNLTEIIKIRQSSRRIVQELGFLDNQFSNIGSFSECHALYELKQSKRLTATQIGKLLNLEKSTVSRLIKSLQDKGYCLVEPDPRDIRSKLVKLSEKGEEAAQRIDRVANQQVASALELLDLDEKEQVINGLYLYAKALKQSRIKAQISIRPLQQHDVPFIIEITKKAWLEFGFDANHPDAPLFESELDELMRVFIEENSRYYVIEHEGIVVGGGGFNPIGLKNEKTCQIQNMYFLPDVRGIGLGSTLLKFLIETALTHGFKQIYLETMDYMYRANALYQNNGFTRLNKPQFNTGHDWTNCWYLKKL